ncbi:MAG TPA: 50S ribosomal protein L29 [Terriglobia bacterium]|jgi:large subunit ribosomal protein L29|nr:50S ribosomal protein L29 [Terriglobia bacterium]
MKPEKIRELDTNELKTKEKEFSDQLFRLKFQFAGGQNDTLAKIRELKKDIARVKTILRQRELESSASAKA